MQLRFPLHADPDALADAYRTAHPFSHVVLDGLFPDELLERALEEFPGPDDIEWRRFEGANEKKKLGYRHEIPLPPFLWDLLQAMNAPPMLDFLERLTGIDGLIPDPYFGGAGPHQILRGGFLKVHVDFNVHPKMKIDRRLNLLIYLNKGWQEEWGGHLELWNEDVSACEERILPVFNRTVVFSTTETSYHGHPHPLACPPGESRKSLSFYYYTASRPEGERAPPHDTVFPKVRK